MLKGNFSSCLKQLTHFAFGVVGRVVVDFVVGLVGFTTALLGLKRGHGHDRELAVQFLSGLKSTFNFK